MINFRNGLNWLSSPERRKQKQKHDQAQGSSTTSSLSEGGYDEYPILPILYDSCWADDGVGGGHDSSCSKCKGYCYNPNCPPVSMKPSKKKYQVAIVACGEYWTPQRRFQKLKGVKRVIVGYTGGQHPCPSFHDTKDHTLALFIEYNPKRISYLELLQMWHDNDYPWEEEINVAYQSAIYVMNNEQHETVLDYLYELRSSRSGKHHRCGSGCCDRCNDNYSHNELYVHVNFASTFFRAELYQQDYIQKQIVAAKEQTLEWLNGKVPTALHTIME